MTAKYIYIHVHIFSTQETAEVKNMNNELICKVVEKETFIKFDKKVKKIEEVMNDIENLNNEQIKIKNLKNKIPCVKEFRKAKTYYNSLVLEYNSIVQTCKHFEKNEKVSPLGFKVQKKFQSMKKGEQLHNVRREYRGVLSRQIVIARDEMENKKARMEEDQFYKKLQTDYNNIQFQKRTLQKEVNNLKKSLANLKIAPKAVLFATEEGEKYIFSGIRWIPKTRTTKKIKTY